MRLEGKRIFLRHWKKSDVPRMFELCQDRTISRFTTVPFPYTKKHAIQFVNDSAKNFRKKESMNFAIVLKENNLVIGSVSFTHFSWRDKNAGIGYWLAKEFRGKEIMLEACAVLMDFGFNKLKLHRIQIDCAVKNKPSKRVIEKLGCKFEGLRRERGFLGGKFVDTFSFAILDREFNRRRAKKADK